MIITVKEHLHHKLQSPNIVKNGINKAGKQKYKCHNCGFFKILESTVKYTEERKKEIMHGISIML